MSWFSDALPSSARIQMFDTTVSLGGGTEGFSWIDQGTWDMSVMNANGQEIRMTNESSVSRTEFTGNFWFDNGFNIYSDNFANYNDVIRILKPNTFTGSGVTDLTLPSGTDATLPISFTDGVTTISASPDLGVVDLTSLNLGGDNTIFKESITTTTTYYFSYS